MSELKVCNDYLEACQAWQQVIDGESTMEAKLEAGDSALKSLVNNDFRGTRKVIVDADTALFIPDQSAPMDEQFWPFMQFGRVITRGWLGRLNVVKMSGECFIDWALYNPSVIGPVAESEIDLSDDAPDESLLHALPIDRTMQRTLHFPVGLINYAICYAQ